MVDCRDLFEKRSKSEKPVDEEFISHARFTS